MEKKAIFLSQEIHLMDVDTPKKIHGPKSAQNPLQLWPFISYNWL